VTARLTNVADESSLWSQTFDEEFTDVFTVQDAISERVAAALAMRLSAEEKKGLTRRYTEDVEAYHLYLKGLYHLGKVTPPAIRKGIEFFQQAVEMDPVYALAYAGIAEAYRRLPITSDVPPKEAFPRAKAAALKALEIDDTLAEAHMSLGWVRFWYEWDWREGEKELLRAIELSPGNGVAQMSHLVLLATQGRMDEAIQAGYRAIEFEPHH
jgi:tetratricopeptide (TPR) repeat protein